MKVFSEEKSFASLLEKNIATSVADNISIIEPNIDLFAKSLAIIEKTPSNSKIIAAMQDMVKTEHPDLMYGSAILVSTVMNLNDDIFTPEDVWSSRYTPVNTPYNDNHTSCEIIGHIISAQCKNKDGKAVSSADDMTMDQENDKPCPDNYLDVEVGFVMYKSIFPETAKKIIEGAADNSKFVSMECVFQNFDYGLVDSENNMKIVKRDETTAFLTKYLKAYGGDGLYDNYRIGRVLRDIRFVGMGNVNVPANIKSKYTKIGNVEFASINKVVLHITKGSVMKVETLEQANAEIEKLIAQNAEATEANRATSDKLTVADQKVAVAEQTVNDLKTQVAQLEEAKKALEADLNAKNNELNKIHTEAKAQNRFNQLKEVGMKVDEAKKLDLATWSDEQFASLIDFAKSLKATNPSDQSAEDKLENVEDPKNEDADVAGTAGDVPNPQAKMAEIAAKLVASLRNNKIDAKK